MQKKEILRGSRNFQYIYKKGKSVGDKFIVLFYKKNGLGYPRRAFLASKKVGNAVQRNRARRLMKESFSTINAEALKEYDVIFIARNTITKDDVKCDAVKKSMKSAIKRSKIGK